MDEGSDDGSASPQPGSPLKGLDAARDAVRPRVRSACFGQRSVGEQLKLELQVGPVRWLQGGGPGTGAHSTR